MNDRKLKSESIELYEKLLELADENKHVSQWK